MIGVMIISFIILLLLGMPVAFAMAISGTLALFGLSNVSWILVPQRMFLALNSFPFLAIPLFILAGELIAAIPRRISLCKCIDKYNYGRFFGFCNS